MDCARIQEYAGIQEYKRRALAKAEVVVADCTIIHNSFAGARHSCPSIRPQTYIFIGKTCMKFGV